MMVSRINKLNDAIQGAKVHLSESLEQHSNHGVNTGETEQISDSRMSRLIGKSKHNDQRKPLLLRVGTKNRPTFDLIADGICGNHDRYCNGTNTQYEDLNACMTYLTKQTRFGQAYELGADTLVCRMVHENMIPYRPDIHCPHIGPSGGGMCVDDYTYGLKVLEPFFTHAPFVPYGYHNSNMTIAAM